jgi:hypothetical protein
MNAQKQYQNEAQSRYLRHLQSLVDTTTATTAATDPPPKQARTRTKKQQSTKLDLGMDTYVPSKYRVYNIILDSSHRNRDQYPYSNDFVLKLQENLRNVVAIRIMKTEYYQSENMMGYMVFNDIRIPLQANNVEHAYLYLNGYINTVIANESNIPLFGRIGPGTEQYPAITANPFDDPYIYVMRPVEQKMRRFHIKLLTSDGTPYTAQDSRVLITLAVYCLL